MLLDQHFLLILKQHFNQSFRFQGYVYSFQVSASAGLCASTSVLFTYHFPPFSDKLKGLGVGIELGVHFKTGMLFQDQQKSNLNCKRFNQVLR